VSEQKASRRTGIEAAQGVACSELNAFIPLMHFCLWRTMNTGEAEAIADEQVEAFLPKDILRDDEVVILAMRPSALFILLASLGGLMAIIIFHARPCAACRDRSMGVLAPGGCVSLRRDSHFDAAWLAGTGMV
jgi:hypothetical protein